MAIVADDRGDMTALNGNDAAALAAPQVKHTLSVAFAPSICIM
jgi:hypothetical protein